MCRNSRLQTSLPISVDPIDDIDSDDVGLPRFIMEEVYDEIGEDENVFFRDDDDMLSEREDRLVVESDSYRRSVERCILVGAEDVEALRKDRVWIDNPSSFEPGTTALEALEAATKTVETAIVKDAEKSIENVIDTTATSTVITTNVPPSRRPFVTSKLFTLEESMGEMRELIRTSGMEIEGEITQRLSGGLNPRTYIGTGKCEEVRRMIESTGACTIVFDAELSPGQQKALENIFNKKVIQDDFLGSETSEVKVIDRTALILDIFAQHAKTREGKLQVELALQEYRKPRLTRMWTHLERQSGSGGVGLRGMGESQLEVDKRLVRDRIIILKRKIDDVSKQRKLHRKGRERSGLPVLALVGYTNAGKSTLLNLLTKAGVLSEDILFATLDPTTRRIRLPGLKTQPEVLLTDTVGFIQGLPSNLVAAFRATLEEVKEADLLIHVVDASSPSRSKQERAVRDTLRMIGAESKPVLRVLNKIDLLDADEVEDLRHCADEAAAEAEEVAAGNGGNDNDIGEGGGPFVALSSITGEGIEDFVAAAEDALMNILQRVELLIPYTMGKEVNMVQEVGQVDCMEYRENGTYLEARLPDFLASRLRKFRIDGGVKNSSTPSKWNDDGNDDGSEESGKEEEIDWKALGRGRHSSRGDRDKLNNQ